MIIDDLHVLGVPAAPEKAKPPPVVDPDRMLALAVALERFKAIVRWPAKIDQLRRGVQNIELSQGDFTDRYATERVDTRRSMLAPANLKEPLVELDWIPVQSRKLADPETMAVCEENYAA